MFCLSTESTRAVPGLILFFCLSSLCYFGLLSTPLTAKAQATALPVDAPVERELPANTSHSYSLALQAGQYVQITARQISVDLAMAWFDPEGNEAASSSRSYLKGEEVIFYLAESSGTFTLQVSAAEKFNQSGSYQLLAHVQARPTEREQQTAKAFALLRRAAHALDTQGRAALAQTIKDNEAAIDLLEKAGARDGLAIAVNKLAGLYENYQGAALKAEPQYERALALWRERNDQYEIAATLIHLGDLYRVTGRAGQASATYESAVAAAQQLGASKLHGVSLNGLGLSLDQIGEKQRAIEVFEQARQLYSTLADQNGLAAAHNNLALVYNGLGDYQKAIDATSLSIAIKRQINAPPLDLAPSLNALAVALHNVGRAQAALVPLEEALQIVNAAGHKFGQAVTLNNLGLVYLVLDPVKARNYYEQAVVLRRAVGDQAGLARTLNGLGTLFFQAGDLEQARVNWEGALAAAHAARVVDIEALILRGLGKLYARQENFDKQQQCVQQGWEIARRIQSASLERVFAGDLALLLAAQNKLVEARPYFEDFFRLNETMRTQLRGQESRSSFATFAQDVYPYYVDLLMKQNEPAAALALNESTQARSLVELLAEAQAEIKQGVDAELLAEQTRLQTLLNTQAAARSRLLSGQPTAAQLQASEKEIAALTWQYQESQSRLRAASPRYAALTQPQALTLMDIQQQVLDEETVLLEFALGPQRSHLFVVTASVFESYVLPKRAEIEQAARAVYRLLSTQPVQAKNPGEPARRLSQLLLAPLAGQLSGRWKNKRLLIVAPGALQYIPFGVLPAPASNQSLLTNHEIISLPSASVLAVLRKELAGRAPAAQTVAVLGDPVFSEADSRVKTALTKQSVAPPAPTMQQPAALVASSLQRAVRSVTGAERAGLQRLLFSRDEAEAITAFAPAASLKALDFQASRATALSEQLAQYRIIHFATHGLLDSAHPELSGLALSLVDESGQPQDGYLRLNEIYNLKLNADLVVLSACQTGLGKDIKGEGLIGLTRGFMYAGAPRVVASLWQVNDAATAVLMKRFYRGLLKEKLRPAAALRQAQLELRKKPAWRAPYYWGAFVLQGEWK